MPHESELITADTARRLLLAGQGLLHDPARRATPAAVYRCIERMGFVQIDTINIVQRAHHHILLTRFDGYEPSILTRLLERRRKLFEHWTHDASVVPVIWLPHWSHRFERYRRRGHAHNAWWSERMGGDAEKVIEHVIARIEREGPLASRDFQHNGARPEGGSWWGWKPQKAAMEYLWRIGRLAVARRVNFHKVYDLFERVFPEHCELPASAADEHVDWACRAALERLGCATAGEIAAFFRAISPTEATAWCRGAAKRGQAVEVRVEAVDGSGLRKAWAPADWRRRAGRLSDPPQRMRLLSPFDPVIRDRTRAQRLFGFDYRFEAFVPAKQRRFGYYVMPILEEDRLVGRVDPKFDRDCGRLVIRRVWWEPHVRVTGARRRRLEAAVARLAGGIGAERFEMPPRTAEGC